MKIGFYIMSGKNIQDGPFESADGAKDHLAQMAGLNASPELLAQFIVEAKQTDKVILLDLYKERDIVVTGHWIRRFEPERTITDYS